MWFKFTSESGKRCLINMAYANVIEEFKGGCMIQFDPEFAAYVKEPIEDVMEMMTHMHMEDEDE
jgi:hypothetical protein